MQNYSFPNSIVVTCLPRLTPWLKMEIENLGYTDVEAFSAGVRLKGTLDDCVRLNLRLRCASQVLFLIREFRCFSTDDVYRHIRRLPWEDWLAEDAYFSVKGNVHHPSIRNPLFANVRVKDAIVDRFRDKLNTRPDSGSDDSRAVLFLYWIDEDAALYFDTSGESIAKHGYRKYPGKAPMIEALASACLMAAGWSGEGPLVNPMCGSGTLAIEAAMMATNRFPGLIRNRYGFMYWRWYNSDVYERELEILRADVKTKLEHPIIATDISPEAIKISKANAAAAGVSGMIQFEACKFEFTRVPETKGMVILNPEYGERLGEVEALEPVYKGIGDYFKQKAQGYKGFVFTGNPDLAKKIGLKASRRYEFYNAKIDCRLLQFEMYEGSRREKRVEE